MFWRKASSHPPVDDGDGPSKTRAALGKKIAAKLARNPMIERLGDDHLTLYVRDDFLSAPECAELRDIIDDGARPSALFSGTADASYRTSDSCHMPPEHRIIGTVSDRIAAIMGIDPDFGERIQGQRYREGQEYKYHCDYFPVTASYWPAMRDQGGQRCWTAMIYLNTVESGGETIFPHPGVSISPVEGRLLIWNNLTTNGSPNENSLHAANPVLCGTKYVVTKWFRERNYVPKV